jgi:hypothetical protein
MKYAIIGNWSKVAMAGGLRQLHTPPNLTCNRNDDRLLGARNESLVRLVVVYLGSRNKFFLAVSNQ